MNIIVIGAAGFIGKNLALFLAKDVNNSITLVDEKKEYFDDIRDINLSNFRIIQSGFLETTNFDQLLLGQDVVYHLVSTTIPTTSNQHIYDELKANVDVTSLLLDSCVKNKIKQIVFISSGCTVYGEESSCPLSEDTPTNPITSYGIQKITIEKLLYLYNYMYNLDYRIVRLSNPYGPYQRPNGVLGALTTFVFKALKGEDVIVYGDGSVVRDFIYIDDAIKAIINVTSTNSMYKTYNIGSGHGTSIRELLTLIEDTLNVNLNIKFTAGRRVDVPVNYLDISRYEKEYGLLPKTNIHSGICETAEFLKKYYKI